MEHPKTFISYSWASKSYVEFVIDLADKLVFDGVDVIFDQYDMAVGHDMFYFMEKIAEADKVLILCDKTYMEKANSRKHGVGTETRIITPELFKDAEQTKFIPVVTESWDYVPIFLRSLKAIDITPGKRKEGYTKLLQAIYDIPEAVKALYF